MAKVEIDTPGVTIRIEDDKTDAETLGAQALVLYRKASEVDQRRSPGPAGGLNNERRGTPTHTDPNYSSSIGFAPVKAEGRNDE